MGFTVVRYWETTDWSVRPRSSTSRSPAEDPLVRVRLHKDLDVEHIPQSGVLEDQDALTMMTLAGWISTVWSVRLCSTKE